MSADLGLADSENTHPVPRTGRLHGLHVAVVGMGYVGLPTALAFVDAHATVTALDNDDRRLADIKDLRVDLLPPDWSRLAHALQEEQLALTGDSSLLETVDAIVVCVPTPIDAHQTPDLTALSNVCRTIVEHARHGQTIILTSTTYAGCTYDLLVKPLQARGFRVGRDVYVAFSPERINPGVDEHAPQRTPRVVGGYSAACGEHAASFLTSTAAALHMVSSPETAELTKLLENTFRAVNIALANEFADAADELGVDVMEVIDAASTKPYGFMPFYPGAGVGGHCIPCDPHYLLWQLRAKRADAPVTAAAMGAISGRPRQIVTKARHMLGDRGRAMAGAKVLLVGITYKPDVADTRESPALTIIDMLAQAGARVSYTDLLVEEIETPVARKLRHVTCPAETHWDLVIVHTVHATQDYDWLADQSLVLDTTHRLALPVGRRPR